MPEQTPAPESPAVDHPDLAELARRRGLYFPSTESYGGTAGLYTYGPTGAALKRNVEAAWRERFVTAEGNHEIDSPTIVPEDVFEASGHRESFDDMLVACPDCDRRHRADHLVEDHATADVADAENLDPVQVEDLIAQFDLACPDCGHSLAGQPVEDFNLMFETAIGPGSATRGFLRPETAQGTLVEFPRLAEYARNDLPFGVAQVGRAYRNEISPRKTIVRLRELTLAELQTFHDPERDDPPMDRVADADLRLYPVERQVSAERNGHADDPEYVEATASEAAEDVVPHAWTAYYLGVVRNWFESVGVSPARLRFRQHRETELAHYATDCWDAEAEVDGEWIELAGIAYRADHDLANHAAATDETYTVFREYDEPRTTERVAVDPDMAALGPQFGDRAPDVVDALERLAEADPDAFDADEVAVDLDDETVLVDADHVDVRVETVTEHGEQIRPHVAEPSIGVDRVVYAALAHSLRSDAPDGEERTYLSLPPATAPTLAAVFPLTDAVADRARDLADDLQHAGVATTFDDSGSIGRRYRRQDEVGTPYCVTVDEQTPEDGTVTVRDRDSTDQVRVSADELARILRDLEDGLRTFEDLRDD